MERRLGISIYPEHSVIAEDKKYIELASRYGFSRIFMCMLSVSHSKEMIKEHFSSIISYAKTFNFEVILDIAPNIFDALGISYDNLSFFHELGADGIRLDLGFDGNKEALLSFNEYNLKIELNMSNDVAYLDNIITYKPNTPFIYGCHNFYPQKGTGLPYDFFLKCSQRFKKYGVRTAAFISAKDANIGPWNINDGLCTLEIHRNLPIEVQAKHLYATGLIDDVIIGNAYASEEELKALSKVNKYQVELSIETLEGTSDIEKTIMFKEQHFRRGDISSQVVRSTEVRKKYAKESIPEHDNKIEFKPGDVVIGNDQFGKYKGELQLVLESCYDERKNLVGRIAKDELILLDFIEPWSKFKLVPEREQ
ncbi:DUF871 domain-containing protein [Desnuesiella massiliensis]|uniref:DUF871 domain-containing protein n=1 Tax=Desnuesiella massiliensis TaxID=1650662 RepID=UPI0006E13198|nr:MupG family TIM beta-alpha barrel fold protein [Desnuesiella massiliensis]